MMKNIILSGLLMGVVFIGIVLPTPSVFAQDNKLIFAAQFDDVKSLDTLIKSGVNPNVGDVARGETALMWCVRENSYKVFDYLLKQPQININAHAKNGDTALMLASYLDKIDYVKKLIAAGADTKHEGWTALHYAAVSGNTDIMSLLLNNGANVNALSPNQTTPLMMASRSGHTAAIQLLMRFGADIHLKNEAGMNAYNFAIEAEKSATASLLKQLAQ